jgi:hypothetical protein
MAGKGKMVGGTPECRLRPSISAQSTALLRWLAAKISGNGAAFVY